MRVQTEIKKSNKDVTEDDTGLGKRQDILSMISENFIGDRYAMIRSDKKTDVDHQTDILADCLRQAARFLGSEVDTKPQRLTPYKSFLPPILSNRVSVLDSSQISKFQLFTDIQKPVSKAIAEEKTTSSDYIQSNQELPKT